MPHRSNQPVHRRPQAVATLPPADATAERLLSSLADVAIDQMLSPAPPRSPSARREAAPRRPILARPVEPLEDAGDVRLSPQEQAALRGGEEEVDDPLWTVDSGEIDAEATMAMPTDEELAALLGEPERSPKPPSRRTRDAALTDAAAQLAAELDEELAPPRMRPLEPTLPSRAPRDLPDDDGDAIQAEGAIEDRGSVNRFEPAAVFDEPVAPAPEIMVVMAGDEPPAPYPLWALPLVWINAPLAGASQGARQTIGKVAVMAFLNAAAVLLYVLTLRR